MHFVVEVRDILIGFDFDGSDSVSGEAFLFICGARAGTSFVFPLITSTLSFFDAGNNQHSTKADHFLDSVLENSNSSVLQTPPRVRQTPPTSPSRAVSSDTWIPDLSSFLGNINSAGGTTPQKENKVHHQQSAIISLNEDSVQSTGSEVDRQLLSMMGENSVDFTSKFAKLASAVVGVSTSSSSSLQ